MFNRLFQFFFRQQSVSPSKFQAFILEPILTPSGIVETEDWFDAADAADGSIFAELGDDLEEIALVPPNAAPPAFESGYFTVGESGEVGIDFLFDSGKYQFELAIFSLEDLDETPGSEAFIREAARRALSDSTEGYTVISDRLEGARFDSDLGEGKNWNSGEYMKVKTFQMEAGTQFGIMLVPNGSIEDVYENPDIGGSKAPLFSLSTANPDDALHLGQIADVTGEGNTFVMEDVQEGHKWFDRDYNDLIFQVRGATGEAVELDEVIDPGQDWRETDMGQSLLDYAEAYEEMPDADIPDAPQENQPLIGIIDTGFSPDNPDFDTDIQTGRDWLDGDDNPFIEPSQGNEAGTHRMGIIAANSDNDLVIDGINDDVPLWLGRADAETWSNSLNEFVDTAIASEQPHAVVNLSFPFTDAEGNTRYELTSGERDAIAYAQDNGIILVVAAGDDGGVLSALAQASQEFDNIITVGGSEGLERTDYSNFGRGLDILIEGGTEENPVISTLGDEAGTMAGTGVAASRLTGAVSQVWAANPELSYLQVIDILGKTARDIGTWGEDGETGAGLLNIAAAVNLAIATNASEYNVLEELEEIEYITGDGGESGDRPSPDPNYLPQNLRFSTDRFSNPSESVILQGKVKDYDGITDLDRVEFFLQKDGGEWVKIDETLEFSPDRYTADAFKFERDLGILDPGNYYLQTVAYDSSNIAWELETEEFTVLSVPTDKELSDRVKVAIERSMNLRNYDANILAKTREWIVSVQAGISADELAALLGVENLGVTGDIPNTYRWQIPGDRDPLESAEKMRSQVGIEFAYPLVPLEIEFHDPANEPFVNPPSTADPNDPQVLNQYQWHLQSGVNPFDANVTEAWNIEIPDPDNPGQMKVVRGDSVVIGFIDDGFAIADPEKGLAHHWDLAGNYRPDLSWDFDEGDGIPSTRVYATIQSKEGDAESILSDRLTEYELPRMNLSGTIENLTLNFEIEYDGEEDLDIYLKRPPKSQLEDIFNQPDDLNDPLKIPLRSGVGGGSYSLVVPDFNGKAPKSSYSSQWTLEIDNRGHSGSGILKSWSLDFETLNRHGTSVAGVAVADGDNDLGGSGVAPGAQWAGLRINAGKEPLLDPVVAAALNLHQEEIDIYSNSWGTQFFSTIPGGTFQIEEAIAEGRDDKGNIYVFAAGNDARNGSDVNYNYLANARQSIAVGAMRFDGKRSEYSEKGAALFIVAPSSTSKEDPNFVGVTTTDVEGQYRHDFGGTSSATPFVSGVVALMLEANPDLTWRDVQHILAETANREGLDADDWTGGDRVRHSHEYGFGAIDAEAAVKAAIDWLPVNEEISLSQEEWLGARIPEYGEPPILGSDIEFGDEEIEVEWVEVVFNGNHQYIGELEILLEHEWTNETGEMIVTESVLSELHQSHNYNGDRHNAHDWVFSSARHWGEPSTGTWTLRVRDMRDHPDTKHNEESEDKADRNEWIDWKLNLYGTEVGNKHPIPDRPWIRQMGTQGSDRASGVTVDDMGNVYVVGTTDGDLEGTNEGQNDVFLTKYDIDGNLLWKEQIGTSATDEANGITVDSEGNIYLTGFTNGDFTGNSAGGNDAFLMKLDETGNEIWTQQLGTTGSENAYGVKVDETGNIYIIGHTWGSLDGTNQGANDAFTAKYGADGNLQWTRQIGSNTYDIPSYGSAVPITGHIAVSPEGNVAIAGSTYGDLADSSKGAWDGFVVQYDTDGNLLWKQQIGSSTSDRGEDIVMDAEGNVYVLGITTGAIDGNISIGNRDSFLVKYDKQGNKLWTKQLGSSSHDDAWSLDIDRDGQLYITGQTAGSFNSEENAGGGADAFLLTLDKDGNLQSSQLIGTSEEDAAFDVNIDRSGNVYLAGYTQGDLAAENAGDRDFWVSKNYIQPSVTITTNQTTVNEDGDPVSITITRTGSTDESLEVSLDLGGSAIAGDDYTLPDTVEIPEGESSITITLTPIDDSVYEGEENISVNVSEGIGYKLGGENAIAIDLLEDDLKPPILDNSWIRQLGTTGSDRASGVTVDDMGNVYVVGITDGDLEGTNAGENDAFVAKYDIDGNLLWKEQIGTSAIDETRDIAVGKNGHIYITGHTFGDLIESNEGFSDVFFIELDADGKQLLKKQVGSSSDDYATGITVDDAGDIYLTGFTGGNLQGNPEGGYDPWVAKYNSSGEKQWEDQFATSSHEGAIDIAIDSLGNTYIVGHSYGEIGENNEGSQDAFVIKYNPLGIRQWEKQLGTSEYEEGHGIAIDSEDNIYIVGNTNGSIKGQNQGWSDVFVTKFNPQGDEQWKEQFSSTVQDSASRIAIDKNNIIYVTGVTNGTLNDRTPVGGQDAFVTRLNSSGEHLETQILGTTEDDLAQDVHIDRSGNIYLAGYTQGDLAAENAGDRDFWVSKNYIQPSVTITTNQTTVNEDGDPVSITITRTGSTDESLEVSLDLGGSAIAGDDYTLPDTVEIPEGESSITIELTPIDDSVYEGEENISVNVSEGIGYKLGGENAIAFNLVDDETLTSVEISPLWLNASEDGFPAFFNITRQGGNLEEDLTVNLDISGTAINGIDYQNFPNTVTIPANSTSVSLLINPIDDSEYEGDETVVINLADGTGYAGDTNSSFVATITDNDPAPKAGYDWTWTYFGEDLNPDGNQVRLTETPNLDNARDRFLDNLETFAVEDFENFSHSETPTVLNFGSQSATLSGSVPVQTLATGTLGNQGVYPLSGDNYLFHWNESGEFSLNFATPQSAFGFSATDMGDAGEQMLVEVERASGNTDILSVPHQIGGNPGAANFFGFMDTIDPFTKITFINTKPGQASWGLDDFIIGDIKPETILNASTPPNQTLHLAYREDTPLNLSDILVTDPDGEATVKLTLSRPTEGSLAPATSGNVTSTYDPVTGVWQASGEIADINRLLADLEFTPRENAHGALNIATEITVADRTHTGSIALTGIPVNDAPTLTAIAPFTGAKEGQPFTLTYEDLLAASDAKDIENSELSLQILSPSNGTLTRDGLPVASGTPLKPGETLVWIPDTSGDRVPAFRVKAFDGELYSETEVEVAIAVSPNDSPTLQVEPAQQWVRQLGSSGFDGTGDIAVDANNNAIVTGSYSNQDGFIAKYDQEGNPLWTQELNSPDIDGLRGVTTDSDGNIYAVGASNGSINGHANIGDNDGVFVKYDPDGNLIWSRQIGTNQNDSLFKVISDDAGNLYSLGYTDGVMDGESDRGHANALLIKWDSDGNAIWTQQLRSQASASTIGWDLVRDETTGSIYIAGYGSGSLDGETNAGGNDAFIAKYDSEGNLDWNRQLGTPQHDEAYAITLDSEGNPYITGWTTGSLEGHTLDGEYDGFVAKYDKEGNLIWTEQYGTDGSDINYGIHIDENDQVIVTGHAGNSLDGNPYAGTIDAAMTGFDVNGNRSWSQQFGFPGWDGLSQMESGNDGSFYAAGAVSGAVTGQTYAGSLDPIVAKYSHTQTYFANTPFDLNGIYINDTEGDRVTVTLTLSDVNAGTLTSTTTNDASIAFTNGVLTVEGSTEDVNAVLQDLQFNPATDYTDTVTIATSVSDAYNDPVTGATMTLEGTQPPQFFTPDPPYLSFEDSPFKNETFSSFYLENFEDGQLNTPGLSISQGQVINNSNATDSVDADDGNIDGNGQSGSSWHPVGVRDLTLTFDAQTLGQLPTHAGFALTDIGRSDTTNLGSGRVIFEAFDASGNSLGTQTIDYGDNRHDGGTDEDRFLGVNYEKGISTLKISFPDNNRGGEIDHIQYGIAGENNTPTLQVEPTRQWVQQLGSSGFDGLGDVATDSEGNIFLAGWVRGDIDGNTYQGGSGAPGTTGDGVLTKYDREGNKLWTKTLGSTEDEGFAGVATDSQGNAYVVGHTFGALNNHQNLGKTDGFIGKYDPDGNLIWSKHIGTGEDDLLTNVIVDRDDNFYTVGATLGFMEGTDRHFGNDTLIQKWDSDGNLLWTKQFTSIDPSTSTGKDIVLDEKTGDLLIAGNVAGNLDGQTSSGSYDIMVARYDRDGNAIWERQFGTTGWDEGVAIDTDSDGNIYVSGVVQEALEGETYEGSRDAFAAKLDKDGNLIWTKQIAQNGNTDPNYQGDDFAYGIGVDANDQIYVTGHIDGSLDGNEHAGSLDAFVTGLDTDGNRNWSQQFGFPGWDVLTQIDFDADNNMFVAGAVTGAMPGQTDAGSMDLIVAKYNHTQTYIENIPLDLNGIFVNDADLGDTLTVTLTLPDVNAGTLTSTTTNDASTTFNAGVLTVQGSAEDVNAVLQDLQFTPATNYQQDIAIATSVTDGNSNPIPGQTITLKHLNPTIVTNTNDRGIGSLRYALEWANQHNPGTDTITFAIPTTDIGYDPATGTFTIQPLSALPDIKDPAILNATSQNGFNGTPIVEIDGSLAGDGVNGFTIATSDSTIRGFVINRFNDSAIDFQNGNNSTIVGNYLGTDVTGTLDLGNQGSGISGWGAGNIIGGMNAGDRNLISGNKDGGVYISMSDTQVINNYIGTDITGQQDLGNAFGVRFHNGSNNLLQNNLVSGNDGYGVSIDGGGSANNIVRGNFIGTNADGTQAIANNRFGVVINGSGTQNNIIGGTNASDRNLISGNLQSGINLNGSSGNTVQGNYIGTDITGTQSLGNGIWGIRLFADNNAIGGLNAGEGNIISGNGADGIYMAGSDNNISGNAIEGNGDDGIQIGQDEGPANNNMVSDNAIAFNQGNGIYLSQGTENEFSQNAIHDNDWEGIDFKPGYNTNESQPAPTLTHAVSNGTATAIEGTLNANSNTTYRLEFFSDKDLEGQTFLAAQNVTTDSNGNIAFNANLPAVAEGEFVTVTATDPQGNTSKFAAIKVVDAANAIALNHWNASFINRTYPSTGDRNTFDFSNPVATLDLGEQAENGKLSLKRDWGWGSPDPAVQTDQYAMRAWTRSQFEAGQLYKITTQSDDGVWFHLKNAATGEAIGDSVVVSGDGADWRDRSVNDAPRTIFFKVPENGEYDFYVDYYENAAESVVDFTLEAAQPFQDAVNPQTQWETEFYWWDRKLGNQPPATIFANGGDANSKIGIVNLGSNTHSNGQSGLTFNWGANAALNDVRLPDNNYAILARTQTNLEAGRNYQLNVQGDDGFQLLARNRTTGEKVFITPENQWQQAYGAHQTVQFSVPSDGEYDIEAQFYEERGDAYFDLSWQPINFSGTVISTINSNLREGPSTAFPIRGQVWPGANLTFDKWTHGQFIDYTNQLGTATSLWYRIAGTNQWISGALINGSP